MMARRAKTSSLGTSEAFGTFAVVFAIATPIVYVASELGGWPLFTYHPGVNRIDFGWAAARANEGPAMYWYGWIASTLIAAALLGWLASLLPRRISDKIPLFLIWLLPLPALAILAYVLMPFWTH
ncbi:MAG TPA: hypothetical protein VFC45_11470 [Pseudolabrys sp.]|nr:hypothetical protein [Pseudolabrys sp.]